MAYVRKAGDRRLLVALNFAAHACSVDLSLLEAQARLVLSTHLDRHEEQLGDDLQLAAMKASSSSSGDVLRIAIAPICYACLKLIQ